MAGRIITGIEYRLAACHAGWRFSIPPDLLPENGHAAGAGRAVTIGWRDVLHLAGDFWDKTDKADDEAARKRFKRAVEWLHKVGYWAPHPRAEAPAGDSVEILSSTRPSRGRPMALVVRASARFVEAARLAWQNDGAGFQALSLNDYAGMKSTDQ